MLWSCSLWVRVVQVFLCLKARSWAFGKCFFVLLGIFGISTRPVVPLGMTQFLEGGCIFYHFLHKYVKDGACSASLQCCIMCPSRFDTGGQPGREMLDDTAVDGNRLVKWGYTFFPPCILLLDMSSHCSCLFWSLLMYPLKLTIILLQNLSDLFYIKLKTTVWCLLCTVVILSLLATYMTLPWFI